MIIVSSPDDPKVYHQFDCLLDAEMYYQMCRDTLPKKAHLVMVRSIDPCNRCMIKCSSRKAN